ncbi:MAG: phospholipid carrier-dependent glycosyltransferase [Candidatus Omnitrophica bacterium]|nr:phospholipid carrier-dependent glycosyltransferase [Candidatus Omnitrophota bacterium]
MHNLQSKKLYEKLTSGYLNHCKVFFIFIIIVILLGINNYSYLKRCTELFVGDQLVHLRTSIEFLRNEVDISSRYRSPGIFIFTNILYHFFPVNEYVAISSNLFFVPFLLISVYCIVYRMVRNKITSSFAAFLVLLYPISFGLSRFYMMEFALMAAVTTFMACLIYSDRFKNPFFSFLAGAALGVGTLSKESFLIYVFCPLLYEFTVLLREKFLLKRIKNIAVFFLGAMVFLSLWFLHDPQGILSDGFRRIAEGGNNAQLKIVSLKNILFYIYCLADFSISPIYFVLFLIAFIPFLKSVGREKGIVISWILFSYVFFTLHPWKLARYLAPIAPAIAIITAVGLNGIIFKKKYTAFSFIIIFGVIQFLALTYPTPFLYEEYFIRTKILSKVFNLSADDYREDFWICRPNTHDTGAVAIVNTISRIKQLSNRKKVKSCRILNLEKKVHGAQKKKNTEWIFHPVSSPVMFYLLLTNDSIRDCYIDDSGQLRRWKDDVVVKNVKQFDFIISYKDVTLNGFRRLQKFSTNVGLNINIYFNIENFAHCMSEFHNNDESSM